LQHVPPKRRHPPREIITVLLEDVKIQLLAWKEESIEEDGKKN
jgi:hypothetical protein